VKSILNKTAANVKKKKNLCSVSKKSLEASPLDYHEPEGAVDFQ
jgi:hypothetical protein